MNTFKSFALLENRAQVPVLYTENTKEPLSIMECYDEYYNSIMEAEIEFERAYCKGLVAMDEDTTVLNEGIIAGIIEFIQSIITGIIDFFSSLFGGGGGSSSSGGSSTSSEVKTTKLYYEKFVKAKDKYVKTIQPNFNVDVTVDGKVLKTSYNTFEPENFINPKQGVAIEFKDETDQLLQFVDKIDAMVYKANLGGTPPVEEIKALEDEINQASDVYSNYSNNASTRVEYMGSVKLKDYLDTMTEKLSSPEIETFSEKDPSGDIPDNFKEIIDSLNGLLETCKKSDGRVSAEVTDTVKKALASVSSYTTKLISQYSTVIKERYKWVLTELTSYVKAVNSFSTSDTGVVSTNLIEEAAILSLYETNNLIKESQSLLNEDLITLYENPFDEVNDIINESQTMVLNEGIGFGAIKGALAIAVTVAGIIVIAFKCLFSGGSSGGGGAGGSSSAAESNFDQKASSFVDKQKKNFGLNGTKAEGVLDSVKDKFKRSIKVFSRQFTKCNMLLEDYYTNRDDAVKVISLLKKSDLYNKEIEVKISIKESDLDNIKTIFNFLKNEISSDLINEVQSVQNDMNKTLDSINSLYTNNSGDDDFYSKSKENLDKLKEYIDKYNSILDKFPEFDYEFKWDIEKSTMKLGDYLSYEMDILDSEVAKNANFGAITAFSNRTKVLTIDMAMFNKFFETTKDDKIVTRDATEEERKKYSTDPQVAMGTINTYYKGNIQHNKRWYDEFYNVVKKLQDSLNDISDKYSKYVNKIWTQAININRALSRDAVAFSNTLQSLYYDEKSKQMIYRDKEIANTIEIEGDDNSDSEGESTNESVLLNSSSLHSIKVEQLVAEAVIFSEQITDQERYDKLASLNEAIVRKIQEWWKAGIAKIKVLFAKFMEKMNRVTDANYLKKYKDIILKQPFQNRSYKSKDLFGCMNRTLSLQVPYLDYNKHADILKGENPISTFFQRELAPKMQGYAFFKPNNTGAPNTIEQLANYCKDWFMGTQEVEFNGAAVQEHIKDVYDYLMDMKKIKQSIDKSINDIEKSAANVAKIGGTGQAAKQNAEYSATGNAANDAKTTGDNGTGGQDGTPTPAQVATGESANFDFTNSVYSILYELEVQNPAQQNQQPASGTNANPSASGVRHVEDGTNVDQSAAKDSMLNDVEKVCKNYVDICTTVLKAKLTAIEFTRKELREIVRIHVQDYIGKQDIGKGGEEATNTQQYQNTIANNQV